MESGAQEKTFADAVREELQTFRDDMQKIRGSMSSISHDINATSKTAENNALIVTRILDRMDSMDAFMRKFSAVTQSIVRQQTEQIESLKAAFPAGDMDGHCRYHQSVIEWRELRNKVVREALVKAGGAGVLVGTGWILVAIWKAVKISVTQ